MDLFFDFFRTKRETVLKKLEEAKKNGAKTNGNGVTASNGNGVTASNGNGVCKETKKD